MTEPLVNLQTNELLGASSDDETSLSLPLPTRIFGFCAQQAIETLLKALMSERGYKPPRIHEIAPLRQKLLELKEPLPDLMYDVDSLSDYAVAFRYTEPPSMSESERQQIREAVRILREHVHGRIAALRV